jgi:hypothetical protein
MSTVDVIRDVNLVVSGSIIKEGSSVSTISGSTTLKHTAKSKVGGNRCIFDTNATCSIINQSRALRNFKHNAIFESGKFIGFDIQFVKDKVTKFRSFGDLMLLVT